MGAQVAASGSSIGTPAAWFPRCFLAFGRDLVSGRANQ